MDCSRKDWAVGRKGIFAWYKFVRELTFACLVKAR